MRREGPRQTHELDGTATDQKGTEDEESDGWQEKHRRYRQRRGDQSGQEALRTRPRRPRRVYSARFGGNGQDAEPVPGTKSASGSRSRSTAP